MIPKKLYFTFSSENLPDCYQQNIDQWKEMHPDWEISLFTDEKIYQLFEKYFPQYYQDILNINCGPMLADFFRYAVLYIDGGVYTDIDTKPLKKIPEEWLTYGAVIGHEVQTKHHTFFCQWTLLSQKGYPLFKKALNQAFQKLKFYRYSSKKILEISGPLFFTKIVNQFSKYPDLLLLDHDYFARCPQANLPFTNRSVVEHQFHGELTWKLQQKLPHIRLNLEGL